ncbi:MAG: amidophosphoribosyltransferase [Parvularculaceae bacterium]
MTEEFGAHPFDGDKLKEKCGIVGVSGHDAAAAVAALGLHALQHRGQEAAGIVSSDGENFYDERHAGHVGDIFGQSNLGARDEPSKDQAQGPASRVDGLKGRLAIGHVRYATAGGSAARNIQPLYADLAGGSVALAHNGNLTNALALREQLVDEGAIFQSTSDTECIIQLMAKSEAGDMASRLVDALRQVEGAYSLLVMTRTKLIAVRDPLGVRPLVMGRIGDTYVFASETCALDVLGAKFERDIEAGEMVVVSPDGVKAMFPFYKRPKKFCIFEYVYFSRPDSSFEGVNVYHARKRIGADLARVKPVRADYVCPVPDSGVAAALGYAEESRIPFQLGLIRSHYVARTFIEPSESHRHNSVKLKFNANRALLNGKSVILVDDSIVRGTTSRQIIDMVREAGASEVHVRVASPPTTHSCFYGVDTPEKQKLLAHRMSVEEMRTFIQADSLAFVELDGLYRAVGQPNGRDSDQPQYCDACYTGQYPTRLTDHEDRPVNGSRPQLSLLVSN